MTWQPCGPADPINWALATRLALIDMDSVHFRVFIVKRWPWPRRTGRDRPPSSLLDVVRGGGRNTWLRRAASGGTSWLHRRPQMDDELKGLLEQLKGGQISRRDFVHKGLALGMTVSSLGLLLHNAAP